MIAFVLAYLGGVLTRSAGQDAGAHGSTRWADIGAHR